MSQAAKAASLQVQDSIRDKWATSRVVARQGSGVFFGNNQKDYKTITKITPNPKRKIVKKKS